MKPPQHLIDRYLADGILGVITSAVGLGAALAVKTGANAPVSVMTAEGERLPPRIERAIARAHAAMVAELRTASAEELECAIALYSEHLRQAGYVWDAGRSDN